MDPAVTKHDSVLLDEALDFLNMRPDGYYLDCTGGAGGHSAEILSRLSPKGRLWICDYDPKAVALLKQRFLGDDRVSVHQSRFSLIFDNLNFSFDGILADFGISSLQLSDAQLGIGFLVKDAFLDMRIDPELTCTASDLLKSQTEEQLADIFFHYGGERGSRRLARAIVEDRTKGIFYTTSDELRDLCARVLGRFYRQKKIHPATKIFQALRIAVNSEIDEVKVLLQRAPQALKQNGRLVVISFHEGEDRLAKKCFKELACSEGFFMPQKKVVKPTREEIVKNPRARSARMRVLERSGS